MDRLEKERENLKDEQKQLENDHNNLNKELNNATKQRKKQHEDFEKTKANQESTIHILKKALERLRMVYRSKEGGDESSSLIQTQTAGAPETGTYSQNESSNGVVIMLETVIHDAEHLLKETVKDEKEGNADFLSIKNTLTAAIKDNSEAQTNKRGNIALTSEDFNTATSNLGATNVHYLIIHILIINY